MSECCSVVYLFRDQKKLDRVVCQSLYLHQEPMNLDESISPKLIHSKNNTQAIMRAFSSVRHKSIQVPA
jgi:hypothetical protein